MRKKPIAIQHRGLGKAQSRWVKKYEKLGFTIVKIRRWSDGTQTVDMEKAA
jgi:hypothetical protein